MLATREGTALAEYLNPVYPRSFPDPFVLKLGADYYAYCTGFAPDGNVFATLHSHDLVSWTEGGGAMLPLDSSPPYYWAPEVIYDNGKFYLYYSVGNEVLMELRVAVSERPDGGFVDSGRRLTKEDFAIDAHVFIDDDGARYLFYATDFLAHTHIGTGTVVDRMIDWFTLEGDPRAVTRAKYDWQVYDPNRKEKGGVRWHTVEGPTVLKRKGLYYEMFSGGNWQNTTYGVSFAVTDDISADEEWRQFSDGENVLPILRTLPRRVVGPGHNSVVRGPNNRELYCVYHRWSGDERVMAIDRMDFAGDRIFIVGASDTPQPAPFKPTIKERFEGAEKLTDLLSTGSWTFTGDGVVSGGEARSEFRLSNAPESFLCEFVWALAVPHDPDSKFGVAFETASGGAELMIHTRTKTATWGKPGDHNSTETVLLPADFDPGAEHVIRVECDHRDVRIQFDSRTVRPRTQLDAPASGFVIFTDRQPIRIRSFELTEGFEELFDADTVLENGWEIEGDGKRTIMNGELILEPEQSCLLRKGPALNRLEFAANFRGLQGNTPGEFGLALENGGGKTFRLGIDREKRIVLAGETSEQLPLPGHFELADYHQLRIIKTGAGALCYIDDVCIGEFPVADADTRTSVYASGGAAAIEMIRVTRI